MPLPFRDSRRHCVPAMLIHVILLVRWAGVSVQPYPDERFVMKILNLGCGTRASPSENVIDIDWSMYLRIKRSPLLRMIAMPFLSSKRKHRLEELPDNILVHDLSKGIPFEDSSADAVYACHFLSWNIWIETWQRPS